MRKNIEKSERVVITPQPRRGVDTYECPLKGDFAVIKAKQGTNKEKINETKKDLSNFKRVLGATLLSLFLFSCGSAGGVFVHSMTISWSAGSAMGNATTRIGSLEKGVNQQKAEIKALREDLLRVERDNQTKNTKVIESLARLETTIKNIDDRLTGRRHRSR